MLEGLIGVLAIVMSGVMVAYLLWLLLRKNKAMLQKNQYDERQLLAQGKGYKYAYIVTICGLGIVLLAPLFGGHRLGADFFFIGVLLSLFAGVLVFSIYCIRAEAFLGLKQRWKEFIVLYIVVTLANLANVFLMYSSLREEGLAHPFLSCDRGLWVAALGAICFTILLIAMLVARKRDVESRHEEAGDEAEDDAESRHEEAGDEEVDEAENRHAGEDHKREAAKEVCHEES